MEIPASAPKLRRELNIWEAVGISLALMAPSMAANINPQGTAGQIGRATVRIEQPRTQRRRVRGEVRRPIGGQHNAMDLLGPDSVDDFAGVDAL